MKYRFLLICCFLITQKFFASHIAGGDITYTCLGGNQYQVNLNLFVDCFSSLEPDDLQTINLTSTCGGSLTATLNILNPGGTEISQLCPAEAPNSTCNGGSQPGMKLFRYTGIVTLAQPCDTWTISWNLCCRNGAILNLETPSDFDSYIQTTLNTVTDGCNNSPTFNSQPIPYVCLNQPVNYDYGVVELEGDSLHFSLINAMDEFGTNLVYSAGFSAGIPIPGINLDPITGLLTFTPTMLGNFVVVVMIEEFDSNGNLIGTVMRDIQFVVENCSNILPDPTAGTITNLTGTAVQTGPYTLELCEGSTFTFDAVFTDANATDVLTFVSNVTTILPGAVVQTSGTNPLTATVSWTASPGSSNSNTVFNVSISDGACPILGLQNYIYNINVLDKTYAGPDQTICGIQESQINAIGGNVFTWSVISGDPMVVGTNFSCNPCADPIAKPLITTTYEVVSDLSGTCINRDTITISVVPNFTFTINQTVDLNSCSRHLVQLDVVSNPVDTYTYSWSPSTYLNDDSIANPLADILLPGTYEYFVTVESPLGCVKQDSVSMVVNPIPNVILSADTTICIGESSLIQAFFGTTLADDFDGTTENINLWSNINGATLSTSCGAVSGNALHFNAATRIAQTVAINSIVGGDITFSLIFGSGGAPCEDADASEDVVLEYSIDGGTNWINIDTYAANTFITFTSITVPIPAGAMTSSTLYRWRQVNFSGVGNDNWALDDVTIDVSSDVTNYTFEWFDGLTSIGTNDSILVTPTQTTSYRFVMTETTLNCQIEDSITIYAAPNYTLTTTNDTILCNIAPVNLSSIASNNEDNTYLWSPAATIVNPNDSVTVANPTSTITYYLTVISPQGCEKQDSVLVTVGNQITQQIIGDTIICMGESTLIQALFGSSLTDDFNGGSVNGNLWSNVNGATLSTSCGAVSGNALHFNAATRIAETVAINSTVGGNITFSLIFASGTAPCEDADAGEDVALEYSIDGGTNWINIATYAANTFTTFTSITVPIPAGAMTSSTLYRWRQINFSGVGNDNWALDDVTIDVSSDVSGFTMEWFDGPTSLGTNDSLLVTPTQQTTYVLVMTDTLLNCQFSDSITILPVPNYTLTTTNDTILCNIAPVNLSSIASNNEDNTYLWSPAATIVNPNDSVTVANPTSTITYYLTVISPQGCEKRDSVLVTVGNQITKQIIGDTIICMGESTLIQALFGSNLTDDFNGGSVNGSLWSNVNGATLSTSCGAVSGNALHFNAATRIAQTVAINSIIGGNITFSLVFGSGGAPCEDADAGEDVALEYSIDGGTNWINIATYAANTFTTFTSITVPIPAGAMMSSTLYRWRQINFSGVGNDNWALDDVTIGVSSDVSGFTMEWFDGPTSLGTNDSLLVTPTQQTTYVLVMTDTLLNCQFSDSITVLPVPNYTIVSSNDTTLCGAGQVNLSTVASNNDDYTYLWSPAATIVSPNDSVTVANTVTTTTYAVEVTSSQGCKKRDTVVVTIIVPPVINAVSNQSVCSGLAFNTINFTGTSGATFNWTNTNTNVGLAASGTGDIASFTATTTTTESATISVTPELTGCEGTPITFTLTLNPLDNPAFSYVDNVYCPEDTDPQATITGLSGGTFSAIPGGLNFNNSTGLIDLSASVPTTYTLTYTTNGICQNTSTFVVTINPSPIVNAGVDTTICDNLPYVFSGSGTISYTWDQGVIDGDSTTLVPGTVIYTVTGTDANGCTDTDQVEVVVVTTPNASFTASEVIGNSPLAVTFTNNSTNGTSFTWNFNNGSAIIDTNTLASQESTFEELGTYNVSLTADNGVCSSIFTLPINVVPVENAIIYVPNIFTPNNDGKNDLFWIDTKHASTIVVEIFNRWGNKMLTIEDFSTKWDGTINGNEATDGVYFFKYTIVGVNGLTYTGQGNVQLSR